jgi:PleD family two-component response regulator
MAKKVLLVDDSTSTLMMEEMILKQRTAYGCVTAKDGLDEISRDVVESPDLVLMGAVTPRLNGLDACTRMRLEQSAKTLSSFIETAAMRESPSKLYWGNDRQSSSRTGVSAMCPMYPVPPFSITAVWP